MKIPYKPQPLAQTGRTSSLSSRSISPAFTSSALSLDQVDSLTFGHGCLPSSSLFTYQSIFSLSLAIEIMPAALPLIRDRQSLPNSTQTQNCMLPKEKLVWDTVKMKLLTNLLFFSLVSFLVKMKLKTLRVQIVRHPMQHCQKNSTSTLQVYTLWKRHVSFE